MGLFEDPGDSGDLYGKPLRDLPLDTAVLRLYAPSGLVNVTRIFAYRVASECRKCAWSLVTDTGRPPPPTTPPVTEWPLDNTTGTTSSYLNSFESAEVEEPRTIGVTWEENSKYEWSYSLRSAYLGEAVPHGDYRNELCRVGHKILGQYGVYDLWASPLSGLDENSTLQEGDLVAEPICGFEVVKEPVAIYNGLLACFIFYLILAIALWASKKVLWSKEALSREWRLPCRRSPKFDVDENLPQSERDGDGMDKVEMVMADLSERRLSEKEASEVASSKSNKVAASKKRSKALDVFRGINIVLMIFVNFGGAGYYFFEHAPWDGLYVADLVFPWFAWIMGAAIPLAMGAHLRRLEQQNVVNPKRQILWDAAIRAAELFFIGIILVTSGGRNDLETMRIFGVLQRLALCYFFATAMFLPTAKSSYPAPSPVSKLHAALHGAKTMLPTWILAFPILLIHTIVVFVLPVPGCPSGYLGPGGLHENGEHYAECVGGATGYIDRTILTVSHLYQYPTSQELYKSAAFDPEGLWGILPAILQTILGAQAGLILVLYKKHKLRVFHWLAWGLATGALGAILGLAGEDGVGVIPINKNLWSLSFVLVTSGLGFFLLAICYFLTDMTNFWNGAPFLWPGMNSLAMYIGHSILHSSFPWRYRYGGMNTHFDRLVENLWASSCWVFVAYVLYKKKLFLKV